MTTSTTPRRGYVRAAEITEFRLNHHPGTPGSVPVPDRVVARFLSRLVRVNARGCIEVRTISGRPRNQSQNMYVALHWTDDEGRKRQIGAHRLMLLLERDVPLPAATYACHRCTNPACVAHTYPGSPKQNQRDRREMERIIARTGKAVVTLPLRRRALICEAIAA